MLRHLKLTNFRKHEDLDLALENGIIVFRAANEAGKTTLIEAIAYAMFGARACRQPLEEVVTWGKPLNSLRVDLSFEMDGTLYSLKRSKSGAELNYEGGVVTGQNEVTGFIERLMGAPAGLATSLWFANQGTIRGALEAGPKATAQLIEQLADFGIVDQIIELIQAKLPTGAAKPYEERLKQAQDYVDQMDVGVPVPDESEVVWLFDTEKELPRFQQAAQEAAEEADRYDREVFYPLSEKKRKLDKLGEEAARLIAEHDRLVGTEVIVPKFDEDAYETAKRGVEANAQTLKNLARVQEAFRAFKALPGSGDAVWDGDEASYSDFKKQAKEEEASLRAQMQKNHADTRVLKERIVQASVCGWCDKDVSQFPEVATKNAQIKSEIDALEKTYAQLTVSLQEKQQELSAVAHIDKINKVYESFIAKYGEFVVVNSNSVPPVVTWSGEEPHDHPTLPDWEGRLMVLEATKRERERAIGQADLLKRQIKEAFERLEAVEVARVALEDELTGYDEAAGRALTLTAEKVKAKEELDALQAQYKERREAFQQAVNLYEVHQKNLDNARSMLDTAKRQLVEVNFNNTLLKKIRASRPVIVDRLWQVVLSAVSYYFSQMRGVQSVVARAEGGFQVDGQAVEGLSGSTLDILGLSIRLALLKTFLPRCGFLVLDEPAAACDDGREGALIGTVAASGFDQTLLVTHSDLADAYANQLVTL